MTNAQASGAAATALGYSKKFIDHLGPTTPPFAIPDAPEAVRSVLVRVDFDPRRSASDRSITARSMTDPELEPREWALLVQRVIEDDIDCQLFGAAVQYAVVESYDGPRAYEVRDGDLASERKLIASFTEGA